MRVLGGWEVVRRLMTVMAVMTATADSANTIDKSTFVPKAGQGEQPLLLLVCVTTHSWQSFPR